MHDTDLNLLMVHADDHSPAMEPVADDSVEPGEVGATLPEYLWDEGADPNDLETQRWGLIVPEGARGDRLLDLIRPLRAHREAQQGGHEVRVYRVPPRMSASEAAVWKKTHFRSQADLDIDLPKYQLILGDLDEVPLSLQQVQATDGYVGRLAFDEDDHYAAYVHKLLRWEQNPSPHQQGRAVFHTVHDGTAATGVGYRSLIQPGMAVAHSRQERGQLQAAEIRQSGELHAPSRQGFVDAAQMDRPGFLFSLSHGEGPPRSGWRSAAAQREGQGAMSFGQDGRIHGNDLRDAPFLPGGMWFMLACFGAGSPDASAYAHWLEELKKLGQFRGDPRRVLRGISQERPFIAHLPKTVLASDQGPLSFVGHIDLAWTYSFQELDQGAVNRPAKFFEVMRSAMKGDRMGIAFHTLERFLGETNGELTSLQDESKRRGGRLSTDERKRAGHLWMLRQDLSAYVLLGDPAARLPLAEPAPAPRLSLPFSVPAPTPSPDPLPLDIDTLEEAIGAVLVGDDSLKSIARAFGLERSTLRELADRYRAAGRAALGLEK